MNRVSRVTVGALVFGAALLPMAPAQAEVVARPAAVADAGTGSSTQSIMCTVLRLMLMNQGPAWCQ
ncbi:hypothetical protein ACFYTQ_18940 [Nocardia sp. NPDC004068]|uniref:hypothetical protein n=1 Tax=Nocardia sp. NPDC004068 TaxID=3364303 RepID=UPI0036BA6162